jgi:hypothetical protein
VVESVSIHSNNAIVSESELSFPLQKSDFPKLFIRTVLNLQQRSGEDQGEAGRAESHCSKRDTLNH